MTRNQQRNLFLMFVLFVAGFFVWMLYQLPKDLRSTLVAVTFIGIAVVVIARWAGGRVDAYREYKLRQAEWEAKHPPAPRPVTMRPQPYHPSGDFRVRETQEQELRPRQRVL